jgi:hypothetical protein
MRVSLNQHQTVSSDIKSQYFWWMGWQMPKVAKKLTPLAVSKIKVTGWQAVGHV